jgi:hypothetical protein
VRTVRRQILLVFVQAGDAAKVDQEASLRPPQAQNAPMSWVRAGSLYMARRSSKYTVRKLLIALLQLASARKLHPVNASRQGVPPKTDEKRGAT